MYFLNTITDDIWQHICYVLKSVCAFKDVEKEAQWSHKVVLQEEIWMREPTFERLELSSCIYYAFLIPLMHAARNLICVWLDPHAACVKRNNQAVFAFQYNPLPVCMWLHI